MLPMAYILIIVTLCVAAFRFVPESKMTFDDGLAALFFFGCCLFGGAIGWYLPILLQENLQWGVASGWLMRTAQVIGAIAGFLIALRGAVVWISLFLFGVIFSVIAWVVLYIIG